MGRSKTRRLALAIILIAPATAHAHFEHMLLSTRTVSLGNAFVSIADDPSATADNPAGLTGIPTLSAMATYQRPYGVDGLNEGVIAAAVPAGPVSLGVSWFHRGLGGALSEDMMTVAVARDLKRTSEDASLSIGANVDLARVSVTGGDAATAVAVGAGVLLRPFAFIGLGYSIRAINQPEFDLVPGGASTPLRCSQAAGLAYYWQQRVVLTAETREDADGVWRAHGGVELVAGPVLSLRAGLDGTHPAVGAGVTARGWTLDMGMSTHDSLGASYLITLRYARPRPEVPYGATP
jgi:hypothetical protein